MALLTFTERPGEASIATSAEHSTVHRLSLTQPTVATIKIAFALRNRSCAKNKTCKIAWVQNSTKPVITLSTSARRTVTMGSDVAGGAGAREVGVQVKEADASVVAPAARGRVAAVHRPSDLHFVTWNKSRSCRAPNGCEGREVLSVPGCASDASCFQTFRADFTNLTAVSSHLRRRACVRPPGRRNRLRSCRAGGGGCTSLFRYTALRRQTRNLYKAIQCDSDAEATNLNTENTA